MNFLIWTVTCQHWIKWTMTFSTIKAFFMPHCTLGQLLFSSKHNTTASWTTFTWLSLNWSGIYTNKWSARCNIFLAVNIILMTLIFNRYNWIRLMNHNGSHIPHAISLQETRSAGKSISMRTPFLAIASFAIDFLIRSVTCNDWI